ncbi:hypothetical protein GCM10010103_10050 [Streptomyces paradoxus]
MVESVKERNGVADGRASEDIAQLRMIARCRPDDARHRQRLLAGEITKGNPSKGKGGQNSPCHGWFVWCKTSRVISRPVEASGHPFPAVASNPCLFSRWCTRLIRP